MAECLTLQDTIVLWREIAYILNDVNIMKNWFEVTTTAKLHLSSTDNDNTSKLPNDTNDSKSTSNTNLDDSHVPKPIISPLLVSLVVAVIILRMESDLLLDPQRIPTLEMILKNFAQLNNGPEGETQGYHTVASGGGIELRNDNIANESKKDEIIENESLMKVNDNNMEHIDGITFDYTVSNASFDHSEVMLGDKNTTNTTIKKKTNNQEPDISHQRDESMSLYEIELSPAKEVKHGHVNIGNNPPSQDASSMDYNTSLLDKNTSNDETQQLINVSKSPINVHHLLGGIKFLLQYTPTLMLQNSIYKETDKNVKQLSTVWSDFHRQSGPVLRYSDISTYSKYELIFLICDFNNNNNIKTNSKNNEILERLNHDGYSSIKFSQKKIQGILSYMKNIYNKEATAIYDDTYQIHKPVLPLFLRSLIDTSKYLSLILIVIQNEDDIIAAKDLHTMLLFANISKLCLFYCF